MKIAALPGPFFITYVPVLQQCQLRCLRTAQKHVDSMCIPNTCDISLHWLMSKPFFNHKPAYRRLSCGLAYFWSFQ